MTFLYDNILLFHFGFDFDSFWYTASMPLSAQYIDVSESMRDILQKYESYGAREEVKRIQSAYEYAKKSHQGVLRKSGDEYITHPVSAA